MKELEPCFEPAHFAPEDEIPLIQVARAHETTRCENIYQTFSLLEAIRKIRPSSRLVDLQVTGAKVQLAKGVAHENPFLSTEAAHVMPGQLCCRDKTLQDFYFQPKSLTHLALSGNFGATTVALRSLNRADSSRERTGKMRDDFLGLSKQVLLGGVSATDAFHEFQTKSIRQIPICQGKVQQRMLQVMNRAKTLMSEKEQWKTAEMLAELIIMEGQCSVVREFQLPKGNLASYYEPLIEEDLTPQ